MSARRIFFATALVGLSAALMAQPVSAQFTPRFSSRDARPPVQWHVGFGATVVNLGDYTSAFWPALENAMPVFHGRAGVAIPLSGESLFILPEIEFHAASTSGEYQHPLYAGQVFDIPTMGRRGFSIMLSLVRSLRQRYVLMGAGLGYHLIEYNPTPTRDLIAVVESFHQDPFNNIGIGFQAHYARRIAELAEDRILMLEGRYKAAFLSGNASGRTALLSEFQVSFYIAFK